jgi:hypothetical protein
MTAISKYVVHKGDIVEYPATDGSGRMERAIVLEVFENLDIRTDMDGVRCRGEYTLTRRRSI